MPLVSGAFTVVLLGVIVLAVLVLLPLWLLLHFLTQWRRNRGLSPQDEALLEELWETAARMEDRVRALEEILAADLDDRDSLRRRGRYDRDRP